MPRVPRVKTEERTRKRLDSFSSQIYAQLISAGVGGATPEELEEYNAACSARQIRSHLSCLVTEGLAERVGYHVWSAIIPARKVWGIR